MTSPLLGYAGPFGGASRSSQCGVPYRRLGALTPVLDEGGSSFVYACGASERLVGLHRGSWAGLFERASMATIAQASSPGGDVGLGCGPEGWLLDRERFDGEGARCGRAGVRPGGASFVERITAKRQVLVELVPTLFGEPQLYVRVAGWRPHKREPGRGRYAWTDEVCHVGYGSAVELDGAVIVAMASGEVCRYLVDDAGKLARQTQLSMAPGIYQVSAVGSALALLVGGAETPRTGGCHLPWAEGFATGRPATTRLVVLDGQLAEQWSVSVDFPVTQPAVDLGGRNVGLFGRGLAVVRDGRVIRAEEGDALLRATAYDDGHFVAHDGVAVTVQTVDGQERQRLEPPKPAYPLVSFPCVDERGGLWLADAKRVLRASPA